MQLQTLSRTHKANNKQLQKSHEVLQVPTMPNNVRYLGLVLFILGSWLAIVVDVFILLDSRFSRTLMAVGGEVGVSLSPGCWLGKCSFCKSSCITSHGCEVFRGIAEVCHWWHIRMTKLSNTSRATEYLVLGDLQKVRVQGGTRSTSQQSLLVSTKGKICQHPSSFAAREVWRRPSKVCSILCF
jgi:hypothetical protein